MKMEKVYLSNGFLRHQKGERKGGIQHTYRFLSKEPIDTYLYRDRRKCAEQNHAIFLGLGELVKFTNFLNDIDRSRTIWKCLSVNIRSIGAFFS